MAQRKTDFETFGKTGDVRRGGFGRGDRVSGEDICFRGSIERVTVGSAFTCTMVWLRPSDPIASYILTQGRQRGRGGRSNPVNAAAVMSL